MICEVIALGNKIYFCWLTELPVIGIDERTSSPCRKVINDTPKYRYHPNAIW